MAPYHCWAHSNNIEILAGQLLVGYISSKNANLGSFVCTDSSPTPKKGTIQN